MRDDENDPDSAAADPAEAARAAGLRYVTDEQPGIARSPRGDGFAFRKPDGSEVADERELERIRKLAIPPAWTDVWVCASANGHLQATGRDARGRKQYRYHPRFRELREETKYEHMMAFARALPELRAAIARHLALRGLPREKVLATVVHLLETTLIRVGNDDYARRNKSYGLTTLRNRHVAIEGTQLRFEFKGKSGKAWKLQLRDRRVASVVRACQELPGQRLFQYRDDDGELREVTSSDVNSYLREISGRDITAKDFRTWAGTVMAALALQDVEQAETQAALKKNVRAAIETVAARLGNTPAICRKCYVHPEVLQAYAEGELLLQIQDEVAGELVADEALRPQEAAVLALLQARLERTLEGQLAGSLVALDARAGGKAKGGRGARKGAGAAGQREAAPA
jgi:DNA topoisomerase-1